MRNDGLGWEVAFEVFLIGIPCRAMRLWYVQLTALKWLPRCGGGAASLRSLQLYANVCCGVQIEGDD